THLSTLSLHDALPICADPESQPMVQARGRPVEHHPEPDQGLAFVVLLHIGVAVVFRLQRGVARIKTVDRRPFRQSCLWARQLWRSEEHTSELQSPCNL